MVDHHNKSKRPTKITSYLVLMACFVVAFLIVPDKREVIWGFVSVNLTTILLFLVRKAKERNALQVTWSYELTRFLCIYLPWLFFITMLPRTHSLSVSEKLIVSAILSGIIWAGIRSQEDR